jgi:hypothetical protein
MADITIVNGVYKPTYNWGAPSCMFTQAVELKTYLKEKKNLEWWIKINRVTIGSIGKIGLGAHLVG